MRSACAHILTLRCALLPFLNSDIALVAQQAGSPQTNERSYLKSRAVYDELPKTRPKFDGNRHPSAPS